MLKVTKVDLEGRSCVALHGAIDESSSLEELIGQVPSGIAFVCREITRVNSAGFREWNRFFTRRQQGAGPVALLECSPAVVEMLNLFSTNMFTVESMILPYTCIKCGWQSSVLKTSAELKKSEF